MPGDDYSAVVHQSFAIDHSEQEWRRPLFCDQLDAAAPTRLTVSTLLDCRTTDVIVKIVSGDCEAKEISIRLPGLASSWISKIFMADYCC